MTTKDCIFQGCIVPGLHHVATADKDIYLVRHAQGFHNVGREHHCDAHLTARGWRQTAALHKYLTAHNSIISPQVVYVSPLTRTLETAAGVFGMPVHEGVDGHVDQGATLFMNHQTVVPGLRCQAGPIATTMHVVALELCRERVGPHPCDGRRDLTLLRARFPSVDFTLAELDLKRQQRHFPQLRTVLRAALVDAVAPRPPSLIPPVTTAVQKMESLCLSDCGPDTPDTPSPRHEPVNTPPAPQPPTISSTCNGTTLDTTHHHVGGTSNSSMLRHNSAGPFEGPSPRKVTVETSNGELMQVPVRPFDAQCVENGEDLVWQALRAVDCPTGCYGEGESEENVCARGVQLIEWLARRPEEQLAVVTHCGILHHMFVAWADKMGLDQDAQLQLGEDFENCELRVVRIRDGGKRVMVERLFRPELDV